jgi:uncharacterized protein (DUF1501 family)
MAFAPSGSGPIGDVMVVVFLRGAADGLNIIVPHGDENYYRARPTLAIPQPDASGVSQAQRVIDLDGFFGLHPALSSLQDAWSTQHLSFIHACGSPEDSHSHFRAMEYMERGVVQAVGPASGWVNRHLASLDTGNPSPLRAVGWGEMVQRSLQGSIPVTALHSISDAHLGGDREAAAFFRAMLSRIYANDPRLGRLGSETLDVINALELLNPATYQVTGGLSYPDDEFGAGLKQLAMLIKAEIGLEVAAIDLGGWDTHFAQGGAEGLMANLLKSMGDGLAAFHADLVDRMDRVILVVMTEFGRRVAENASLGTDHGHGSVMILLGGGVAGGQVHVDWPGLERGNLFGPGDLAVTSDYRDVLSEIVDKRLGNPALAEIFPDFVPTKSGFVSTDKFAG